MSDLLETKNDMKTFYARSRDEWTKWLTENGQTEKSIQLIVYRPTSKRPSVGFNDAIEEALSFGWIKVKAITRDAESAYMHFAKQETKNT